LDVHLFNLRVVKTQVVQLARVLTQDQNKSINMINWMYISLILELFTMCTTCSFLNSFLNKSFYED